MTSEISSPVTVELPLRRWGRPDASRHALLLHGLTSSAACWWRVADGLAAAGWAVVAPDLRGHGDAPRTVRYDIAGFAADVVALTSPLADGAPRPWDLVAGHSLGGVVATAAVGIEPGWAARLLLVDPVITVTADLAAEVKAELDVPPEALLAGNPLWHPEDAFLKARAARQTSPYVVDSFFRHNVPWSYEKALAATTCPTTVLAADPDLGPCFTAAEGLRIAAAKPDFHWSTVPGAGHSVYRDNPEAVITAALTS
ncbi:alpha/beta fold hydrolase [Streptomyces sp. NPDC058653]|uniref:alpha/beta fold hydrolase n=1 Tax=Streptomyces sp. NPDC058653 TaxID=3346576 RepID=UPI003661AECD